MTTHATTRPHIDVDTATPGAGRSEALDAGEVADVSPTSIDVLRHHYLGLAVDFEHLEESPEMAEKRSHVLHRRGYTARVAVWAVVATALAIAALVGAAMLMGGDDESDDPAAAAASGSAALGGGAGSLAGEAYVAPDGSTVDPSGVGGGAAQGSTSSGTSGTAQGPAQTHGAGGAAAPVTTGPQQAAGKSYLPPVGVYTYQGTGWEQVAIFGMSQRDNYGTVQSVVTQNGNCWDQEIIFFDTHRETYRHCGEGGHMSLMSGRLRTQVLGLDLTTKIDCGQGSKKIEPGMQPGKVWTSPCTQQNSGASSGTMKSEGPATFTGIETINVGGQSVQAYRIHADITISGEINGPMVEDRYYAVDSGMLVRWDRKRELGGFVDYSEDMSIVLTSMAPRT